MIPKEKIEEVRDRANIVSVVSEYVPLTKRGANHLGLCPFHSEKTPSFTVSEEKRIYYCFGCNATGNAITFVMKKEGIEFPEAVRLLAKRYGVIIQDERKAAPDRRDALYRALTLSAEYFSRALDSASGRPAREYIRKRGFEGEISRSFGVGFAPNVWEGLAGYLKRRGVGPEAAFEAGVLIKKEKGGYYDRFRGRVIFPITDAKGRVIGFGGRSLDGSQPKYLNTPESSLFRKGDTLYGLYQAKKSIREASSAIIVEGYFDLMALHKYGFTNSVATMGTALTVEHIRALKGHAATVYALFDSDQAGKAAAIRGLNLFLAEEMPCRAVALSSGKDPDEFLAASGPEAMRAAISRAEPLMEFCLRELLKRFDIKTPEGKARYLEASLEYLLKVRNIAERGHYAATAASALGISVEQLFDAMKARLGEGRGGAGPKVREIAEVRGSSLKELTILKVILKHPELYSERVLEAIGEFRDPAFREAGGMMSALIMEKKGLSASAILDAIGDEGARGKIAALLVNEDDGFIEAPERMLEDSLKRVLNRGKIKETTQEMIKRLEETGRHDVARDIRKGAETGRPAKGR